MCGLAVSHVPDLAPVFAEFVRVLRPNGHLVLSDSRGHFSDIGFPIVRKQEDGTFGYMPIWSRLASDFLAAALPLGLRVLRCEELRRAHAVVDDDGADPYDGSPSPEHVPGGVPNIWGAAPLRDRRDERGVGGETCRDHLALPAFQPVLARGSPSERVDPASLVAAAQPATLVLKAPVQGFGTSRRN